MSDSTLPQFPAPTATPDATFTTDHAIFIGQGPDGADGSIKTNFTVGSFLNSVAPVKNLTFSGVDNPIIHAAVSSMTPLSNGIYKGRSGTYATLIELTGSVNLVNGQYLAVAHRDGVSVAIDGNMHSGFNYLNEGLLDESQFSGGSGMHQIDLLYLAYEGPLQLVFDPVP